MCEDKTISTREQYVKLFNYVQIKLFELERNIQNHLTVSK